MVKFTKDLFVWLQVADSPAGEETKTENASTKIKKKPLTLPVLNTLGRSFLLSALFLLLVEESSTKAKTGIFPYRYLYGVFRVLKNVHRMLMLGGRIPGIKLYPSQHLRCRKVIREPRLFVERKAGAFLISGVKKAILLFLVLFLTWQILYFVALIFPILNEYWLFAYLAVFAVAVCFFVLDKQTVRDLGFTKSKAWRYIAVGFVFAVVYNVYWIVVGVPIFSTGSIQVIQHGIFSVPYNLLFALVVGVVEETSFRGYILRNLNTAFSSTKAIIYSSILFGLYHLSFVGIFWSTMSGLETVSYWTLVVLAAVLIGFFLGYFYMSTEQTTIGTITYHSSSIFLESLVPFGLATSWLSGHLLSTSVYILFIPILILLRRKGWLSKTNR